MTRFLAASSRLLFGFALLVALATRAPAAPNAPKLTAEILDIGQGDAVLLTDGVGHAVLIDGGPPAAGPRLRQYLKDRGITVLDAVLISHAHLDHYGGIAHLIGHVKIDAVLYGTRVHAAMYKNFEEKLRAAGIAYRHVVPGYALPLAAPIDARVVFAGQDELPAGTPILGAGLCNDGPHGGLAPGHAPGGHVPGAGPDEPEGIDLNMFSVIVRASLGRRAMVFTGDAPAELEDRLVTAGSTLGADLLKVSHHGSGYSSTAGFLGAVRPAHAAISCATGNDYGHPHADALQRLTHANATVWRTDRQSTIEARTDGDAFTVSTHSEAPWIEALLPARGEQQKGLFELLVDPR